MSNLTLPIGDAHVRQDEDIRRFKFLGKAINDLQPDNIVIMGDFLDIEALSRHDEEKLLVREGKRYWKEIETGNRALDLLENEGFKGYTPRHKIFIEGNHENRLARYLEKKPELHGAPLDTVSSLKLDQRGWEFIPYGEHAYNSGVGFTHIPFGRNGRAVGGKYAIHRALDVCHNSVVFGHTHRFEHVCNYRHGAEHLQQALSVGCFFEEHPDYVHGAPSDWWKGVVFLDIYGTNRFDIYQQLSMSQLFRRYR